MTKSTLPIATITTLDLNQTPLPDADNHFCFHIDLGNLDGFTTGFTPNLNERSSVGTYMPEDSQWAYQIKQAIENAGGKLSFSLLVFNDSQSSEEKSKAHNDFLVNFKGEGIVFLDPVQFTSTNLAVQPHHSLISSFEDVGGTNIWGLAQMDIAGYAQSITGNWFSALLKLNQLVNESSGFDRLAIIPATHGNSIGALAGRLASDKATIADSPARTETGPLINWDWSMGYVDGNGDKFTPDIAVVAAEMGHSVPIVHPALDGTYWSDLNTLVPPTSDYIRFHNLRVVQKAARKILPMLTKKIRSRTFNSSEASIKLHQSLFAKPLREMAAARFINGKTEPGEIEQPKDGDIQIVWLDAENAQVHFKVTPYKSALVIDGFISVNLGFEATQVEPPVEQPV